MIGSNAWPASQRIELWRTKTEMTIALQDVNVIQRLVMADKFFSCKANHMNPLGKGTGKAWLQSTEHRQMWMANVEEAFESSLQPGFASDIMSILEIMNDLALQ